MQQTGLPQIRTSEIVNSSPGKRPATVSSAPFADRIRCETSKPDLEHARQFAEAIDAEFPDKLLAYNCSPSFNWKANLDNETMRHYREELRAMGYKFQFIALAGWHVLNWSMFNQSRAYKADGMYAYL